MDLPETLAQLISGARGCIRQADAISAGAQAQNAIVFLRTIHSYVEATPEIDRAFEAAIADIARLGEAGNDPYRFIQRGRDWAEQARQFALMAVERLEAALEGASPSAHARALGLDWW
jgi:hypothetical protein